MASVLFNESGKFEVYVRPFPPPSTGQGGKWQISNKGGISSRWSRNGHDLLYLSGDALMDVSRMRVVTMQEDHKTLVGERVQD